MEKPKHPSMSNVFFFIISALLRNCFLFMKEKSATNSFCRHFLQKPRTDKGKKVMHVDKYFFFAIQ